MIVLNSNFVVRNRGNYIKTVEFVTRMKRKILRGRSSNDDC